MGKTLDELAEESFSDEKNPISEAVQSLIKVQKLSKETETEIELKTDLTDEKIVIHAVADILGDIMQNPKCLSETSLYPKLVNKIERKLLSKERKSRGEIVEVARNRDTVFPQMGMQNDSFTKRFFLGGQR